MVEQQRPRRPRPPRQGAPDAPRTSGENPPAESAAPPQREVAPWNYRAHIEEEHSLKVIAEPGWPTEHKRYMLARVTDGKERSIDAYTGTLPQALSHFYKYLHPEPKVRRRR